jgi:hypothetical protein
VRGVKVEEREIGRYLYLKPSMKRRGEHRAPARAGFVSRDRSEARPDPIRSLGCFAA